MSDIRPVWLTKRQRDTINLAATFDEGRAVIDQIVDAWDAAPVDPAEALRAAFLCDDDVDTVLRALGMTT